MRIASSREAVRPLKGLYLPHTTRMKPIFGTNWKMRCAQPQFARSYASTLGAAPELQHLEMLFVMPPATLIRDMVESAVDPKLLIGAQDFHWAKEGEFTGELSTALLSQEGARIVLAGHAERRLLFAETNEIVGKKLKRALDDGLTAVLCVGESEQQADLSAVKNSLHQQLLASLSGINADSFSRMIVAYEPVWAIGNKSGAAASPDRVAFSVAALRDGLQSLPSASEVPILYGGSVNLANCFELMKSSGVDGLFVGRSAAAAEDFLAIIRKSIQAAG
jgi:triosephosphate isomerase